MTTTTFTITDSTLLLDGPSQLQSFLQENITNLSIQTRAAFVKVKEEAENSLYSFFISQEPSETQPTLQSLLAENIAGHWYAKVGGRQYFSTTEKYLADSQLVLYSTDGVTVVNKPDLLNALQKIQAQIQAQDADSTIYYFGETYGEVTVRLRAFIKDNPRLKEALLSSPDTLLRFLAISSKVRDEMHKALLGCSLANPFQTVR